MTKLNISIEANNAHYSLSRKNKNQLKYNKSGNIKKKSMKMTTKTNNTLWKINSLCKDLFDDSLRCIEKVFLYSHSFYSLISFIFYIFKREMNPIFNQKYKTTLCRHWLTTNACSIGVRCVFAHGQAELRNPNDPITLNQNILTDPKMLTSFMTTPLGDVAHINAMVSAQQLDALAQEKETLEKAFNKKDDKDEYKNALNTAK